MAQRKPTDNKPRVSSTKTAKTTTIPTATGSIRIVEPKPSKKKRASKSKVVTVVAHTDDAMHESVSGFANFLREYGVVALAVGFIVGQQANAVVKQMVASFVDPLAQVWFGQNLTTRAATLHHNGTPVAVPWGQFIVTLLNFFLILLMIYGVIKLFKLDRFKKVDDKK